MGHVGEAPKQVQKWLQRAGKGDWLGISVVVREWGRMRALPCCQGLVWLELLPVPKEGAPGLPYQYVHGWSRRGQGVMGT